MVLATSHGRRSIDTLAKLAPEKANWDCEQPLCYVTSSSVFLICLESPPDADAKLPADVRQIEARIPTTLADDARLVPGAADLLAALSAQHARWAVVTSGTSALLNGWLAVMDLAQPATTVVAEDVEHGKPAPECYLLGRERIGQGLSTAHTDGAQPAEVRTANGKEHAPAVLVVEDSPSGVRAGKAAGCQVLGLATTHSVESVREAGADWIVRDLQSLKILGKDSTGNGWQIEIFDAWA